MRKLFLCGGVLAVLAACVVFMMAAYVERKPMSPAGCCASAACRAATVIDPMAAFIPRIGEVFFQAAVDLVRISFGVSSKEQACASPAAEPEPTDPYEVIDLSEMTSAGMGAVGDQEESTEPVEPAMVEEPADDAQAVTVPPTPIENDAADNDAVPDIMPPADCEAPADVAIPMPFYHDRVTGGIVTGGVFVPADAGEKTDMPMTEDLIQEDLERAHGQQDEQAMEEPEPELLPMPSEGAAEDDQEDGAAKLSDEEIRKIIADLEDPNVPAPPVPPVGGVMEEVKSVEEPADNTPENNQPLAVPEDGSSEESEMHPGTPPDCREDPHHDQQYPGCPYMGGCPGNMHCPPPAPTELDMPKAKKKKKDMKPEAAEDTGIRRMKYEEFATPAAVHPIHPDRQDWVPAAPKIDTMEFRHSEDAKPGEFDPRPF
jgi:hypothetical protein